MQKVGDGVWRLRVYVGRSATDTPIQISRTVHGGVRAAQSELHKMVTTVEARRHPQKKATVTELLDEWLDQIRRERTPRTWDSYRQIVNHDLKPAFGHLRLGRLGPEQIARQYRVWLDAGLSPSTVRRKHAIMSGAFRLADEWGWIDDNPVAKVKAPTVRAEKRQAIRPDELHALYTAVADQPVLKAAIALAVLTGCRRGELAALRWSDIDLARGQLDLSRSLTVVAGERHEGDTKTHRRRLIALDPVAVKVLRDRGQFQEELAARAAVALVADPWVLSYRADGGESINPDALSGAFHRIAKSLGLSYSFHDLRHFVATTAIAGGADVRTVADRLGHANPSITLGVYSHAVPARDKEVAAMLGQVFQLGAGHG